MIITSTPYRVSFFGGGTDYPVWFREHGGAVLATSINRYCYLSCRYLPPFFDKKHRIVWSKIELVDEADEILHPVVREAIRYLNITRGMEIHHQGDLPARSGTGSSSAFTVGILHALYALEGVIVSKKKLAKEAIYIEQVVLKENVGVQDQITSAHGGLNLVEIKPNGDYQVNPLPVSRERRKELQDHLLLIYTGIARTASEVARNQIASIPKKQAEFHTMRSMVDEAAELLVNGNDLADFGCLLHESWQLKKSLTTGITTSVVDEAYEKARAAGALGGKLLGAGGGGFMLFIVRPEDHQSVLNALSDFLMVPIELEADGTRVIFYQPDRYSRTSLRSHDFMR